METTHRARLLYHALNGFFLLHLLSCGKVQEVRVPTTADDNPYVSSYTAGLVSTSEEIQIVFASSKVPGAIAGEVLSGQALSFEPKLEGKTYWKNGNTLVFEPRESMPAGKSYAGTLELGKIIPDAHSPYHLFHFSFRTREQHMAVQIGGMYIEAGTEDQVTFTGQVFTEDQTTIKDLRSCLKASIGSKNLTIQWDEDNASTQHDFRIPDISRTNKAQQIEISFNGNPINAPEEDVLTQNIPAIGEFTLLAVAMSETSDNAIRVVFSALLDQEQDLEGLVEIANYTGNLSFSIEQNAVILYPEELPVGEVFIRVGPALRAANGQRLEEEMALPFTRNASTPAVSLVSQGTIVPGTQGVFFPFQAIGLTAVDVEVFRVGSRNILPLLQEGDIDEMGYPLYRVGKIIQQKTIILPKQNARTDAMTWQKYYLDLNELIRPDPGAIYQIRIGFRQEYALNPCGENNISDREKPQGDHGYFQDNEGNQVSILDNFYGGVSNFSDFNWENREDPCKPEYYHADRFARGNLMVSRMGLVAKRGNSRNLWISVSDLVSTASIERVRLEIYDGSLDLIGEGKTDSRGEAIIQLSDERPAILVATKDQDKAYLRLRDEAALNLSRFDISGEKSGGDVQGFLYAERNIWKPGDSLFFHFMLLDRHGSLPPEYPLTMEVYDARGQLYERRMTNSSLNGIYSLPFTTRVNDETGNWRIRVKVGKNVFEKIFKVESIRPNRLKADLFFQEKMLRGMSTPQEGTLEAGWLTGLPAAGLKALVELKLRGESTSFPGFPSFQFDNPFFSRVGGEPRVVWDGLLSASGRATFPVNLSDNPDMPGKMAATFQTRIFEPSGEASTTSEKFIYHPYDSYVGIEIPRNSWGEPSIPVEKSSRIRFALCDTEGRPMRNQTIRVSLFKSSWYWWWDTDQYLNTDFNTESAREAVKEAVLQTDSRGIADWRLGLTDWGRYLIIAASENGGHRTAQYLYVGYPDGSTDENEKNLLSLMQVSTDQKSYQPGKKAIIRFPGSEGGIALITIEQGDRVLQSYRIRTRKGENKHQIAITPEMAPNVYACVSFIQPYEKVRNDQPIRLLGVCPVVVENPESTLQPRISSTQNFRPGSRVAVAVSEASGKEMTYTLSLVDEGLLGITRFKTPDPHGHFYARQGLGVRTWDSYHKVAGTYGMEMNTLLAIGGDEGLRPESLNPTGNPFGPVSFNLGPFHIKKGGKSTHVLELPNYLGALRVMVVARSGMAFGSAEKTVPVKNPVMLFASAPRQMTPGDAFRLPVTIFSTSPGNGTLTLNVRDESGLLEIPNKRLNLDMRGVAETFVTIPMRVKEKTGNIHLRLSIRSPRGNAEQTLHIPVRNPNPITAKVTSRVLEPGETWEPRLKAYGQTGSRKVMIESSTLPDISLEKRLRFLLDYPYGCLEQTVSGAFSQLYLDKWVNLSPQQEKTRKKNIQGTIQELQRFQLASGGFSYWAGTNLFDEWTTSYAGHFLLEAKEAGYMVPSGMLRNWLKFQAKRARSLPPGSPWASQEIYQLNQAYQLYTLALGGKPERGTMNQLRENQDLFFTAAQRLAGAYGLSGNRDIGKRLLAKTKKQSETETWSATYGSDMRDRAQLLETQIILGNKENAASQARYLSNELKRETWHATHATAYTLMALSKYIGSQPVKSPQSFRWKSKETSGKWVAANYDYPLALTQLSEFDGTRSVKISNTGKAKLYLQIIQTGRLAMEPVNATSSGISINVTYTQPDGSPIDPTRIQQGQDFKARITVKHTGENPYAYKDLGLTQVFPSGWEMVNDRATDFQNQSSSDYQFLDIREDRASYFLDLRQNSSKVFEIRLHANFAGRFFLPATTINHMYDNRIHASSPGSYIEVSAPKN